MQMRRNNFKDAIKRYSVILAHNYPGGSPSPSPEDIEVTKRIQVALEQVSISVLDHIIAAEEQYASCAEKGLLLGNDSLNI